MYTSIRVKVYPSSHPSRFTSTGPALFSLLSGAKRWFVRRITGDHGTWDSCLCVCVCSSVSA